MALTGKANAMAQKIADNLIASGLSQADARQDIVDAWEGICQGIIDEIVASAAVSLTGTYVAAGIPVSTPDTLTGDTTADAPVVGSGSIT